MLKKPFLLNKYLPTVDEVISSINSHLLLGLILLLGIILRFYDLGNESYWIDEMSTVIEGQQNILATFTSGRLDQPPAYYLPFYLWIQAFGVDEAITRSFSTLTGIGSIVLIYLIGRELFSKSVGLVSAFLMAISEYQIYYSQQARFYSYFEFTALLSFLFFIMALEKKKNIYFLYYSLASILMLYSHTFGVFILTAQALYFLLHWKKYKDIVTIWFSCQVFIAIAITVYFYPLIFGGGGDVGNAVDQNIGGIPIPSLRDPIRSVYRFIMSARGERTWESILFNYAIAGVFLVVSTWIYAARKGKGTFLTSVQDLSATALQLILSPTKNKIILIGCWLLCPIIFPFILSLVLSPMYLDRYVISASPALYLLLALGIVISRKVVPIIITAGTLLIMIFPSLFYYYDTDVHEQWKEVAAYIYENSEASDGIVFSPNQGVGIEQKTFNWYYQGSLSQYGLKGDVIDANSISETLQKVITQHDRLWVVIRSNPNGSSNIYSSFFLNPNQTDYQLITEKDFIGISVYLFELSNNK